LQHNYDNNVFNIGHLDINVLFKFNDENHSLLNSLIHNVSKYYLQLVTRNYCNNHINLNWIAMLMSTIPVINIPLISKWNNQSTIHDLGLSSKYGA